MPLITDWIMIAVTLVYVIATIFIMHANQKTTRLTREQLDESKRQYSESHRLQIMPYLQIYITEASLVNVVENEFFLKVNLRNKVKSLDSSQSYYACSTVLSSNLESILETGNVNDVNCCLKVKLTNSGEGIAHHITFIINQNGDKIYVPGEYMIPSHGGVLEAYVVIMTSYLSSSEIGSENRLTGIDRMVLDIYYQDVIGNQYKQSIASGFLRQENKIDFISDKHYISAPELIQK